MAAAKRRPNFRRRKGGKPIHIKPSHEGRFTAEAKRAGMGVQQYAGYVLRHKSAEPGALVKRANFARNAKTKFNHS